MSMPYRFRFAAIMLLLTGLASAAPIPLSSIGNSIGGNLGAGDFETEGATALDLTGPDFSVSAAALGEFGALHARASISFNLTSPGERSIFGFAGWTDQLTISSPGLNGTSGLLNISFLLDGSITQSGVSLAGVGAGIGWSNSPIDLNADGAANVVNFYTSIPTTGQVVAASIPFTYGTPFYFGSFLFAGAGTLTPCPSCELLVQDVPMTGPGSGSANFYDTLALTGLQPFDAEGNPVSGIQFSSASGTAYTLDGVAATAPEPGSLALLSGGILAIAFRARRKRA